MNLEEFLDRNVKLLEVERECPVGLWYLSFAGEDHWKGAVIVKARGFVSAYETACLRGINPGGEVVGHPIPADIQVRPEYLNRLLTKEECEAAAEGEGSDGRERGDGTGHCDL